MTDSTTQTTTSPEDPRTRGPEDLLSRHRVVLLLVLLALASLALPYAGLTHDAGLYAGLVLHRIEPAKFAGDLLLDHATKLDRTVFVPLVAAVSRAIGIDAAFLALHLVSRVAFLLGLILFIQALDLRNRRIAIAAALILAVSPSVWGGYGIFSVNEPFLTPRLPAIALSLIGLAAFLRGRKLAAAIALVAASALHPLMAIGPIACIALVVLAGRGRRWITVAITIVAFAFLALALLPSLAARLFGHVDPLWRSIIAIGTPEDCPWLWPANDLYRFGVRVAIVLAAALRLRDVESRTASLAVAIAAVATGGLAATLFSGFAGWSLPFQAQLHRAEWLLAIATVPLALALARSLRDDRANRLRAFVPFAIAYAIDPDGFVGGGFLLSVVAIPIAVIAIRGVRRSPRRPDWMFDSVAVASIAGLALLGLGRFAAIVGFRHAILENLGGLTALRMLMASPGPVGWALLAIAGLALASRIVRSPGLIGSAAAIVALAATILAFAIPRTSWYRTNWDPDARAIAAIHEYVSQTPPLLEGAAPIVYWPTSRIEAIWLDIGARCYYSSRQFTASIFNRALAIEVARRARVVGAFEADRIRPRIESASARDKRLLDTLYLGATREPAMTVARLCREPLDVAALPERLDKNPDATEGGVYLYDCRRHRSSRVMVASATRDRDGPAPRRTTN